VAPPQLLTSPAQLPDSLAPDLPASPPPKLPGPPAGRPCNHDCKEYPRQPGGGAGPSIGGQEQARTAVAAQSRPAADPVHPADLAKSEPTCGRARHPVGSMAALAWPDREQCLMERAPWLNIPADACESAVPYVTAFAESGPHGGRGSSSYCNVSTISSSEPYHVLNVC
jgi:hypothetical protein